jgi:hypothetical protein
MKAGKYYVGDLCYVMHPQWDEVCKLLFAGRTDHGCNEGVFTLANGVEIACFNTAYGDGTYEDREGRVYPVDSGSIGCILVDDIADPEAWMLGGNVIEFEVDFEVDKVYGSELVFGNIVIDTDPPYDEEPEDEYEEETEEEES